MKNYVILYWIILSVIAIFMTIKDKSAAAHHRRRISEASLMLIGAFGGAEAMYITMKIIRHKTKHKKFMFGLPCEIIFHLIAILLLTNNLF